MSKKSTLNYAKTQVAKWRKQKQAVTTRSDSSLAMVAFTNLVNRQLVHWENEVMKRRAAKERRNIA